MRRRRADPLAALVARGVPLPLARYDPADWPPVKDSPARQGICAEPGTAHAGCRFWATRNEWHAQHPAVDLPSLLVEAGWHEEWV
ncbi:MAG: hypothetical protein M3Y26_09315 [Actinomycetota bacterium]|nr:hypothetical protein [Actinomycetota bacterium]